jgi:uncharacterized protein YndB with AHSA1/START domain
MRAFRLVLPLVFLAVTDVSGQQPADSVPPVRSTVITTAAEDLVLIQEVLVDAAVSQVWAAYTTQDGWTTWASPVAEIDLRAGGTIRTHYDPAATIGDPGTNTLLIVNYVPERLLTLQAELDEGWPEVMKEDVDNLMNVIVLEAVGPDQTRILSYGVGYRDSPAYKELMSFFIPANERLFKALKEVLER